MNPIGAPRQTRRDTWNPRPCVLRYRASKDELRLKMAGHEMPIPYKMTFYFEMPKSWSQKKREKMAGQPHLSKPDKDNVEKFVLDTLFKNDSHVWSGWVEKRWWFFGKIEI